MNNSDFTVSIAVEQSPAEVFDAISNPRGWWSEEIEGVTDKLSAEFNYHFENAHRCKIKIIEYVPDQRVVWLVMDNYFNFTKDKTEWNGNKIVFDISKTDNKTRLQFTQIGLVPEYECFEICEKAWTQYVQQSLFSLITTGKGQPNGKDKPQTNHEKKLSDRNQD